MVDLTNVDDSDDVVEYVPETIQKPSDIKGKGKGVVKETGTALLHILVHRDLNMFHRRPALG